MRQDTLSLALAAAAITKAEKLMRRSKPAQAASAATIAIMAWLAANRLGPGANAWAQARLAGIRPASQPPDPETLYHRLIRCASELAKAGHPGPLTMWQNQNTSDHRT